MPLGNASGIPGANYSYFTSTIDPNGDQLLYSFDWGDGTTSNIGPVSSGTMASANHTWTNRGTYKVKTKAIDSKGGISGWSESLNVRIDAPPGNPSTPSGPSSGRPGVFQTYAVSGHRSRRRPNYVHLRLGRWINLDHRPGRLRHYGKRESYLERGGDISDQSYSNR